MATICRYQQYEFLEDGFVLSRVKKTPRVLKPIRAGNYVAVQIVRRDGVLEREYVHRLICEAFHGPCPEGMECRHLDGNRTNNAASNLAWGTRRENHADKNAHGTQLVGAKNPMAKLTSNDVLVMRERRKKDGCSYKRIAKDFGVSTMTAYRAITGQSWRET